MLNDKWSKTELLVLININIKVMYKRYVAQFIIIWLTKTESVFRIFSEIRSRFPSSPKIDTPCPSSAPHIRQYFPLNRSRAEISSGILTLGWLQFVNSQKCNMDYLIKI